MKTTNELLKAIEKIKYYSVEQFESDAKIYLDAIRQGRMLCVIHSVSQSGMSRSISFHSCEKGRDENFWYRNYFSFFCALGFSPVKNRDAFRINGCGMDMIFYTNYTIIKRLCAMELIEKQEAEVLEQKTPVTF